MRALSEWWLLRRWLTALPECLPIMFPIVVEKSERPDFVLRGGDGSRYLLELTQASHPADQHAMSRAPKPGIYAMSAFGGRGADGFVGNEPERLILSDILMAVRRKRGLAKKVSPDRLNLLLYVNSDPGNVVEFETLNGVISDYQDLIGEAAKTIGDMFVSIRDDVWMVLRRDKLRLILSPTGDGPN